MISRTTRMIFLLGTLALPMPNCRHGSVTRPPSVPDARTFISTQKIQETNGIFSAANISDTPSTTTRQWFASGGLNFILDTDKAIHVQGTATSWDSFGIVNETTRALFDATGNRFLEFDISGALTGNRAGKKGLALIELTDSKGKSFQYCFEHIPDNNIPDNNHMKISLIDDKGDPLDLGKVIKFQIKFMSGTYVDLTIPGDSIKFSVDDSVPTTTSRVSEFIP